MSAQATVRCNKTIIQDALSGDPTLILSKVYEKSLITHREYVNLKSSNRVNVGEQMVELVDKVIHKGNETCQSFLNLLQTDRDVRSTYPTLQRIQLIEPVTKPPQAYSDDHSPARKRQKQDEQYQLRSQPVGLCLIINNEKFDSGNLRRGSKKDARDLSEVFSWLGFRVLMCENQTADQMERALRCFASLSISSQQEELQKFNVKEWTEGGFTDLQHPPAEHGDAFICCILSHGEKGAVRGTDGKPLCIKQITKTFKATDQSALNGKPKVFLIQACQGSAIQQGVILKDLESDDSASLSNPVEADVLVATATVEDYVAFRHTINGSWFVQSLCQQLKEGCLRGDDLITILRRVNNEVSLKEARIHQPGAAKQMPEIRFTTRKRLVLSPHK